VDELWQRYRTFWIPVLYGVGAFLAGLIVVHVITSDPEAGVSQNDSKIAQIKKFTAPTGNQLKGARDNAATLRTAVEAKARLLDQRHADGEDFIVAFVRQALRAAILRGAEPAELERFDGDANARDQASARFEKLVGDSVDRLRNQDPNVAFSRLRADVVGELEIRANRADVDVTNGADQFGLGAVASVERAELPRRLANLALIATVLDAAIREGVRAIDGVSILSPETRLTTQAADAFLSEWPVKIDLTGTPDSLTALLNLLTDPANPTPIGTCSWKQTQKKDGLVKAEMRLYSVRVRPSVSLGLDNEGGD
jgi:hypothetical protein